MVGAHVGLHRYHWAGPLTVEYVEPSLEIDVSNTIFKDAAVCKAFFSAIAL